MTPIKWKNAWAPDPLVLRRTKTRQLPDDAHTFLYTHGLPRVMIFESARPFEMQFARVAKKLTLYTDEFGPGAFTEAEAEEWGHRYVIGTEESDDGGAWYCVHAVTGIVTRHDPEPGLENSELFMNSSLPQFAHSLLLLRNWSHSHTNTSGRDRKQSISRLRTELNTNDTSTPFVKFILRSLGEARPGELLISASPRSSKPRFNPT